MNDINPRMGLIITFAVGGVAIAAWRLAVAPLHAQLAAAKAESSQISRQVDVLKATNLPDQSVIDQELSRVKQQQARLNSLAAVPDGNRIQEQIRALAAPGGLRVDRLERRSHNSAFNDPKQTSYLLKDAFGMSLTVQGPYSAVADFIQAIRSQTGLTKIASVKLSPVQTVDRQLVTAIIETSHMRLTSPPAKTEAPAHKDATK